MENILFKISFPAEFHAQTAVESAITLHDIVKHRLDQIDKIIITTQESAMRIISKTGPLYNYADRDHCLQYMVAVALLHGNLKADYYTDQFADDSRIDMLRSKMQVIEDPKFSKDYLDPDKRSIANAIQIYFQDGAYTDKVQVEYPIGHKRRREAGIPLLINKFAENMMTHFSNQKTETVMQLFLDQEKLENMPVHEFMGLFVS